MRLIWIGAPIGAMATIAFLALFSAGEIYDYQDTVDGVHLPQVDAIVCLAGGRGRISASSDLWYRYWELNRAPVPPPASVGVTPISRVSGTLGRLTGGGARNGTSGTGIPVLYLSGMGPQSNWKALGLQVRRGVLEVLRPTDVVLETESSNTDQNARWLLKYAQERGWERILLVTSRYHMKRARYIFEKVFKKAENPVQIETLSVYQEPFEPGEWNGSVHGVRVTLTEYLKWHYYQLFWKP